jgi:lipopolysaccharide export system permease protein
MRVLRPIIAVATLLAILIGLFSIFVRPWAYAQSYEIRARVEAATEVDRVKGARFYNFDDSGRTVFVKAVSGNGRRLEEIFIRSGRGDDLQVITAAKGELVHLARPEHHQLVLSDANVFRRASDGPDVFAELGTFSLWLPAGQPDPVGYKTKSSSSFELMESSRNKDKAELQWRFSTPFSALLLALLAIPLSRSRPRQGRYARILGAMIIYAVYFNMLDVSRTWVEQGSARYIWWAPGLLALLVATLYVPWRKLFGPGSRVQAGSG